MKKQTMKRVYVKPKSKVFRMQTEHLLQAASGQHKHIGQGGTLGNAKSSSNSWEDWEDEDKISEGGIANP